MKNTRGTSFGGYRQALLAAVITFTVGMSYGAYTMLIEPLSQRLNCSLTAAGLPATFENIACFTTGLLLSGYLIEKWTARRCLLINAFLSSFFLAAYAYLPSLPLLCGWEMVIGASMAFGFTNALSAFIRKWFIQRREAMLGIALASNGLGGAFGVWFYTNLENAFGVFVACSAFAIIGVVCVLLGILFLRNPEQVGQKPLGRETLPALEGPEKAGEGKDAENFGITFREALRTPSLYLIMASCLLCCMSMVLSPYFPTILQVNGVDKMEAANYATINALALATASVVFGAVTAKLDGKAYILVAFGAATLGLVALGGWLTDGKALFLAPAAMLLGAGYGIGNSYGPIVTTKVFGNKCYDRVIPLIYAMRGVGLALGVLLLPSLAERQGSWVSSVLVAGVTMILAIAMGLAAMYLAPMKKLHHAQQPATISAKERVPYESNI